MSRPYHRRVSLILGFVGIMIFILNHLNVLFDYPAGHQYDVGWTSYLQLALSAVCIYLYFGKRDEFSFNLRYKVLTVNIERVMKVAQVNLLLLLSMLVLFYPLDRHFSMELLIISTILALRYQLIQIRGMLITMIVYVTVAEVSAILNGDPMEGLYFLLFTAFFFSIMGILYEDYLKEDSKTRREFQDKLFQVEMRLKKYEAQTLDPEDFPFTKREQEILELLCRTHGSNQELAEDLGIKAQTVKSHIRHIFDKSGVDDRHQLIDLFKHAYIGDDQTKNDN